MTINLKQLATLFAQSAGNEELPGPIRQFAAQLTVLTAHVDREAQARVALDGHIAELANLVMAARQTAPAAPAPAPAPVRAQQTENGESGGDDEENATQAMIDQIQRDTEADVAATNKKITVTPLRNQQQAS